jgi:DNA invertase Pin-like site-specific DNA recombinase
MMTQTIGYLRVSTADQDLEKNKADILMLANHHNLGQVKFFEVKFLGINAKLPSSLTSSKKAIA